MTINIETIILGIVCIGVFWLIFDVRGRSRRMYQNKEQLTTIVSRLDTLSADHEKMRGAVDQKLLNIQDSGTKQFHEARALMHDLAVQSADLVEGVQKKLSALDKTNQRIVDFSAQLQNLQDILKNPKQRGVLGEFILEQVLANVLAPENFALQYGFADGTIVDGVVFVKDKVIPVDAKFSLENYERMIGASKETRAQYEKVFLQDVKARIDETSKYIKPSEKTTDFAFMFIPSEAIYYDLLINKVGSLSNEAQSIIEYAFRDRHVVIVSPTSFLAYLQTVLQGLRALDIEENAQKIKKNVESLNKHWSVFDVYMEKIGKTLGTTVGHFNHAYKQLGHIDRDVMRITDHKKTSVQPEQLEKPYEKI